MIPRIIISVFMISVYCTAAYHIVRELFGPGRTGNYLNIRNKSGRTYISYRILPLYKLILKRLIILYVISFILHLFLPLFYALSFTILILLSDKIEWWEKDVSGMKVSVMFFWSKAGYSIKLYLIILSLMLSSLLAVNLLFFPIVFKTIKNLFEVFIW